MLFMIIKFWLNMFLNKSKNKDFHNGIKNESINFKKYFFELLDKMLWWYKLSHIF